MNDVPPEVTALLEQARVGHEPTAEQLARSLAKLHQSLEFAPEVAASPEGGRALRDAAFGRGGVLATRAARGALLTVVLGASVGVGVLWVRPHPEGARRLPSVAPAAQPAPAAIDAREPAANVLEQPSWGTVPAAPRAALEVRAEKAPQPVGRVELAGKRARASRSVAALGRAGRERTAALVSPAESGKVLVADPEAPSQPVADNSRSESSPDTRAPRTDASPVPSELQLIDGALRSLRDHDPKHSLALLVQHAEQYPQGKLATERRGLRVLALCAAGERARAVRERAAYLAGDPHTPMAERVRRTCRPEGEP